MIKRKLALISVLLLLATGSHAGEGLITKVRGSNLTVDKGAEDGLTVGMKVIVIRPPTEAVIHPVTGENLGAPEINLGPGEITKTSGRASNVNLAQRPLMGVRPGDLVRFTTPEEEMIMEQESAMVSKEKAQGERRALRGNISGLTKKIQATQRRISGLEAILKRLDRTQNGFITQLQLAHKDITLMKEDIDDIKESISLMGAVPVDEMGEAGAAGFDLQNEENLTQLKDVVQGMIDELRAEIPAQVMEPEEEIDLGEDEDLDLEEEVEEEPPFYTQTWFFGIIGAIGILAVVAFLYLKMAAASEEDEEDEEDDEEEELDDEEDEDDEDFEVEEEDDIIVEETS